MRRPIRLRLWGCGVAFFALLVGGCNINAGSGAATRCDENGKGGVASCGWSGPGDGDNFRVAFPAGLAGGNYVLTFHGKAPDCQYDVSHFEPSTGPYWRFVLQRDGTVSQDQADFGSKDPIGSLIAAETVSLPLQDLPPGTFAIVVRTSGTTNSPCPWEATIKQ